MGIPKEGGTGRTFGCCPEMTNQQKKFWSKSYFGGWEQFFRVYDEIYKLLAALGTDCDSYRPRLSNKTKNGQSQITGSDVRVYGVSEKNIMKTCATNEGPMLSPFLRL